MLNNNAPAQSAWKPFYLSVLTHWLSALIFVVNSVSSSETVHDDAESARNIPMERLTVSLRDGRDAIRRAEVKYRQKAWVQRE